MGCGGEEVGGNEAGEVVFEAGIAFGGGEELGALVVDLSEKGLHAMRDGGEIAADGLAEGEEAYLGEREDGLQAQHVGEDVLVGLGAEIGRWGGCGLDLSECAEVIGHRCFGNRCADAAEFFGKPEEVFGERVFGELANGGGGGACGFGGGAEEADVDLVFTQDKAEIAEDGRAVEFFDEDGFGKIAKGPGFEGEAFDAW